MAKTLDDVKIALEGLENDGQELYQAVDSAILHERNTGKGLVKDITAKAEAATQALAKLGFNAATDTLEAFIETATGKLASAAEATSKLSTSEQKIAELSGKVESLTKTVSETTEKASAFENNFKGAKIKGAITEKLTGKLYSHELHIENCAKNAVLGDDNETILFKNGDVLVPFDDGIEAYLQSQKPSLINTIKGGAEGGPTDGSDGGKTMTRAQYDQMDAGDAASFVKDGGKFVD